MKMRGAAARVLRLFARGSWVGRRGDRGPGGGDFAIGSWRVVVAEGTLCSGRETRRLEPRSMDVLAYLAEHAGRVVSRDELVAEIWGGAAITDGAVTRCIGLIRRALGDDARRARHLITVHRRGYQLVGVRRAVTPSAVDRRPARMLALGMPIGALLAMALVVSIARPPTVTVRVQTFVDLDPTAAAEGWGRGLTDDLLGALASNGDPRIVIEQPFSPAALGSEADYLVTGSVRRQGDRARIACRISSTRTAKLHCAQSCEVDARDRLGAQTSTAQQIADAATGLAAVSGRSPTGWWD